MGTRGPGIARATLVELVERSSRLLHAGRKRVEASKALVDVCRLILALEREERAKLERAERSVLPPRLRRAG